MTDRLLPSEKVRCPTCSRSKEDWGVCSDSFHIPAALPTPDLEGLLDRLERDHTWLLDEQSNPDGTMEDEHRAEKAVTAARTALTDYVSRLQEERERLNREAVNLWGKIGSLDAELAALRSERDNSLTPEEASIVTATHDENCLHRMIVKDDENECDCGANCVNVKLRLLSEEKP